MGIRGMQAALKNNEIMKSKRRSMYDRKNKGLKSGLGTLVDHTSMKSHEFADFQKRLFLRKKRERNIQIIRYIVTIVLTILTFILIPYIMYALLGES
jgi:hypothetical protein